MPDLAPKPSLVERLFAQQRGALKAFFRRRTRTTDAADLSQEVYLRMLRIRDPGALRDPVLYLLTVANDLVKEQGVLDRQRATDVDIEAVATQEQLVVPPNFEGELDVEQRSARLQAVLKQLGPNCQAAVILRFTHELQLRNDQNVPVLVTLSEFGLSDDLGAARAFHLQPDSAHIRIWEFTGTPHTDAGFVKDATGEREC